MNIHEINMADTRDPAKMSECPPVACWSITHNSNQFVVVVIVLIFAHAFIFLFGLLLN